MNALNDNNSKRAGGLSYLDLWKGGMDMKGKLFTVALLVLFSSLYLFAISVIVPGNSDFVMYLDLSVLENQDWLPVFQEAGIPTVVSVYGKLSLGNALGFLNLDESAEFSLKNLLGLPLGIVLPGNIGDKSLGYVLSSLFDSTIEVPKLTINEPSIILLKSQKLYIIRSKDSIYLCFNKDISTFTKDMLTGKISSIPLSTKDGVVVYFKTYKKSLIGELLYITGDYIGIPISDELIITKKDEKYRFEATIVKTYSNYEKKLALAKRGILRDLSYIDSANIIIAFDTSNMGDSPLLTADLDVDIPEEIQKLFSFIEIFRAVSFSLTIDGYFTFSGIYKPEYEQDAKLTASFMKKLLGDQGYQVSLENRVINIYPSEIDKSSLKKINDNSYLLFELNYSDEEESAKIVMKAEVLDTGNLFISGEFNNLVWFLNKIAERASRREYEEEWDYEEEEYYEESEEDAEEGYEEEYYDEYEEEYEEEYTDETYYSELEYELADKIAYIFNTCADLINNERPQNVTLGTLYEYGYIDYIPDDIDVKSVVMNDGTVYVIIHTDVSYYDVAPENVVDILYEKNGIYSEIINGMISVILYVEPRSEYAE